MHDDTTEAAVDTESDRMPLTSTDPNRQRIEDLKDLFPEAFTEGQVDFDRLRRVLGDDVDESHERYGLSWAGKAESIRAIQAPSTGTLLPDRERSLDFDDARHVMIEGENLEVLKLLQKSYYGKVKLIYIDPPYNTGKEFVYSDNYREGLQEYLRLTGQVDEETGAKLTTNPETGGRYHSRWLSMMYPRLFLARNLLREDGVIFVSVDDNEVHNLRLMLDEIFGEENFVEHFVWKKSYGGGAKEKFVVTHHEYVLLYARREDTLHELWLPPDPERKKYYRHRDDRFEERGPYRVQPLEAAKSMDRRENLRYPIRNPETGQEVWPQHQWLWSQERAKSALESGRLVFRETDGQITISYKQYLRDKKGNLRGSKPVSVIDGVYTQHGTAELRKHFDGKVPVQFPKPTELIKRFVQMGEGDAEEALILDFFAGSGTTGEAVMRLNAEDGGDRRFVLVQFPKPIEDENHATIADVAIARLRSSVEAIRGERVEDDESPELPEGSLGFKVLCLNQSNFRIWNADEAPRDEEELAEQLQLYADHLLPDRSDEDVLYELLLKSGLPLTARIEKRDAGDGTVWLVEDGELAICLDDPIEEETIEAITAMEPRRVLCLDRAFHGNDALKTNAVLQMRDRGIEFGTV